MDKREKEIDETPEAYCTIDQYLPEQCTMDSMLCGEDLSKEETIARIEMVVQEALEDIANQQRPEIRTVCHCTNSFTQMS
jgi:hypothetical protein